MTGLSTVFLQFLYGSAGLGLRGKKMVVGLGILWIFREGDFFTIVEAAARI